MTLSAEEQHELMARVLGGDRDAFEDLHRGLARQVHGFIRARVDSDADALEISQDTWLKFWKSLQSYDSKRASCITFIRSIACNAIVDRYRAGTKGREVLISDLIGTSTSDDNRNVVEDLFSHISPATASVPPEGISLMVEQALLSAVFYGTSPPHQLLVFGFAELQGWTPREITTALSSLDLRVLEKRLENDYAATSGLSGDVVHSCFANLRKAMDSRLGDALPEAKTRELYPKLLKTIIGETQLCQYFSGAPAQNVSHWCQAVRRRAVSESACLNDHNNAAASARNPSRTRI